MSPLKKFLLALAFLFVILAITPCLLLWGFVAYTNEQTRTALIEYFELPASTSYEEAIHYFDCRYIYIGMTRNEFEAKVEAFEDYTIIPSGSLTMSSTYLEIIFKDVHLMRYYEINPDYVSQAYIPEYGDGDKRIVCPASDPIATPIGTRLSPSP